MIKEISSRKNPIVSEIDDICASPSANAFVLQGDKFIADAAYSHAESFLMLLTTNVEKYKDVISKMPASCETYSVSQSVMDRLSQSSSASSLLAVLKKPETQIPDSLIILDGVQDPGNVGTVIRTAYSFGFGVVCSADCANPFSAKVVRSTAGALLGCYVERCDIKKKIENLKNDGFRIYGSALSEKAESLPSFKKDGDKCAVVIGSEGKGMSEDVLSVVDKVLYIPIKNVESLNAAVAAAIFAYTFSS